jgi:hypothetical protein
LSIGVSKLESPDYGRLSGDRACQVLVLYQKRSGAAHVVEVAEAAAPERF